MTADKTKVSCPVCGTTNYYPADAGAKKVACGRCRSPLSPPGTVLEPSSDGALALIERSGLPVLLDFHSPSCGPCNMMNPIVERLARRRAGDIVVARIDVESHSEMAGRFGVQAVPTFCVFFKGMERGRHQGAAREEDFSLWVAKLS